MNIHDTLARTESNPLRVDGYATSGALPSVFQSALVWLARHVKTCAAHWAASAAYEDLARLSNAELARRGLSRDRLAHDLSSIAHNEVCRHD
jgi:hypothetical protein